MRMSKQAVFITFSFEEKVNTEKIDHCCRHTLISATERGSHCWFLILMIGLITSKLSTKFAFQFLYSKSKINSQANCHVRKRTIFLILGKRYSEIVTDLCRAQCITNLLGIDLDGEWDAVNHAPSCIKCRQTRLLARGYLRFTSYQSLQMNNFFYVRGMEKLYMYNYFNAFAIKAGMGHREEMLV